MSANPFNVHGHFIYYELMCPVFSLSIQLLLNIVCVDCINTIRIKTRIHLNISKVQNFPIS